MHSIKRFLPLLLLFLVMAVVHLSGVTDFFSLETLKEHRVQLKEFVFLHPMAAPLCYILLYIAVAALSIPGATILSLTGGFLFSQPFATIYTVVGASLGAIVLFLVAKSSLGNSLRKRAGNRLAKMEEGFKRNAISYLLFLRLVPVFPFWLVNLAPAIFGVSLFTYSWTTFLGIIPGAFVFTQAGNGIGAIFDNGESLSLSTILNNDIKIALIALGLFALLPILVRRFQKKRS